MMWIATVIACISCSTESLNDSLYKSQGESKGTRSGKITLTQALEISHCFLNKKNTRSNDMATATPIQSLETTQLVSIGDTIAYLIN